LTTEDPTLPPAPSPDAAPADAAPQQPPATPVDAAPQEQPAQPPAAPADTAEVEELKARLAAAEEALSAAKASEPAPPPNRSTEDLVQELRDNWPQEGGMPGVPQPWDLDGLGLAQAARELEPGAPNTVSPIVIEHRVPPLTFGSADQSVHELGRTLGQLGFANSVSKGENPFGAVDASVMAAVDGFRRKYGVVPDPSGFGGDNAAGRELAANHIDAWTVEAIYRVSERESASG
jgi:hypothetical protein